MDIQIKIDKKEVLRYLGASGTTLEDHLEQLVNSCILQMESDAAPRYIYREFSLTEELALNNTSFSLPGKDIKAHLAGCDRCILMAVTLGTQADARIRTAGVKDVARALILDSCATVAVESAADAAQEQIRQETPGQYLTDRFSPGYGDLPLSVQRGMIFLLDAPRKIGLGVTNENILLPRKSITAIIGISGSPVKGKRAGCGTCALRDKCAYRKEGRTCDFEG